LISRLTSLCLSHSQDCGHCDLFVICSAWFVWKGSIGEG
jgi:hypothetical protein